MNTNRDKPNILFLMTDQMQGRVLEDAHPCITPNFDKLRKRGVRFTRAYTPNPICSPARASLMTGLLPHSHGVLTVTHCVDHDQSVLRTEHPHFAQRLAANGYRNGYFGKWHVERSNKLDDFGWHVNGAQGTETFNQRTVELNQGLPDPQWSLKYELDGPQGYKPGLIYGVRPHLTEARMAGISTSLGLDFVKEAAQKDDPWCCFVSVIEPHDPFVCAQWAYDQYDVDNLPLADNLFHTDDNRPGLYKRAARIFKDLTEKNKREAAACYYALITEIDQQFGRLLDLLDETGQAENTIVVLTTDHGETLGAHGLYMKNIGGYEENYNIPLVMAGPGVAQGATTNARVGLHELCPTLCDLTASDAIEAPDCNSFANLLADPPAREADYTTGYAEFFGTRHPLMQRIVYQGEWKLVWNGFDEDELYNLHDDPLEQTNRADDPDCLPVIKNIMHYAWTRVKETDDRSIFNSQYPILRLATFGPEILTADA